MSKDRIAMIQFDKGFLKPEMEELVEEISDMCWGNVGMDEREPYTYQDTLDKLAEFERKAEAFEKFRELLFNRKDDEVFWEMLEILDSIYDDVGYWRLSQ